METVKKSSMTHVYAKEGAKAITTTIDGLTVKSFGKPVGNADGSYTSTPDGYSIIGVIPSPADNDNRHTVTFNGLEYTVSLKRRQILRIGGLPVEHPRKQMSQRTKYFWIGSNTFRYVFNSMYGDFHYELYQSDPVTAAAWDALEMRGDDKTQQTKQNNKADALDKRIADLIQKRNALRGK